VSTPIAPKSATKPRIDAFDYLRGFFIVVIIIDHLWRWPNIFQYVSGRGELWVSAAEGFVIISGLLVGYIRGYKNRKQPLKEVSATLVKRGILLYLWMIITTISLVTVSWLLHFKGSIAHFPEPNGDWWGLIGNVLRLDFVHTLTHFLYLYAIFLVLSPLVIWLLRKGAWWIVGVASLALWYIGFISHIEWLQWQVLFFIPSIAGFYMDAILARLQQLSKTMRRLLQYGFISITAATLLLSVVLILPAEPGIFQHTLFSREPLAFERIIFAFIWFIGLLSLFQLLMPLLKRYLGWLLSVFGGHSLTAYIVHIVPLMICQLVVANTNSFWINSLLAVICVLLTWSILKIPYINKVIPR
jgi:hypothetical protein